MMKLLFVSIRSPEVRPCGGQDIRAALRTLRTDHPALLAFSQEAGDFNSQRLTFIADLQIAMK